MSLTPLKSGFSIAIQGKMDITLNGSFIKQNITINTTETATQFTPAFVKFMRVGDIIMFSICVFGCITNPLVIVLLFGKKVGSKLNNVAVGCLTN